ncbi:VAC14-like protein [Mya arenaria]|uniref:Protein VAC14 homolog n=1 Tax=Mya arenaria TaxID=6604 RepID=A0ABY7EU84_MYAAR|nr:VAC14-like protein [Mya arenaria]
MTDKENAPLSAVCVKALNDKLVMKEYVQRKDDVQIKSVLKILGDNFALSSNPNSRKGGLIGLAAASIALGKDSCKYVNELVKPVLQCFKDADSQVRYYSCEALYNIVKVTRGSVLPFFNEIFDALSKLYADPDQNVKSGTELLDRLMKDIVTESASFDLVSFIPLLRERIYNKNEHARQFIVSWIVTLDAVPDINMLVLLPEILDGLFQILDDRKLEIRKMCQDCLREFLIGIQKSKTYINFPQMANILIFHSENMEAITWLREFVFLAGRLMLPYTSGILRAILPRLAVEDIENKSKKSVREAAESLNRVVMELIEEVDDNPTPAQTPSQESTQGQTTPENIREVIFTSKGEVTSTSKDMDSKVESVTDKDVVYVGETSRVPDAHRLTTMVQTPAGKGPTQVLLALETLAKITSYPIDTSAISSNEHTSCAQDSQLQTGIKDSSTQKTDSDSKTSGNGIVSNDNLIRHLSQCLKTVNVTNKYFLHFMVQLIDCFKKDRILLERRGAFIIRQLCVLLNSEDIFQSMSEILILETDVKFACTMVQTLNTILLTSTELFNLRNQLKHLNSKESCLLFSCLYRSWSHSPVATLALCYLTQNYTHSCSLLQVFGNLEITVDFLNEIDKLIQLIESPIFAYLRLQLLDESNSEDLIRSLYGLLMLLPQAEPFTLLRNRLNCIPHFQMAAFANRTKEQTKVERNQYVQEIKFDKLLQHFLSVQSQHRKARRKHLGYTPDIV